MAQTKQADSTYSGQGKGDNCAQGPLEQQATSKRPVLPSLTPVEGAGSVAQHRVLSMPDLLVIILSQLPHSTLLKAKRVNRTWANIFGHMEIQAALFLQPRPTESALYAEAHSDVLKKIFRKFWPVRGNEGATFYRKTCTPTRLATTTLDASNSDDSDETQSEDEPEIPHSPQWRQLLVCQPPVKVLELVQSVTGRGGYTYEFRTTITRPDGLRMGFLYDAVKHWNEYERSACKVLWNRRSGDLADEWQICKDVRDFRTDRDEPCVTILGTTSVGCGRYVGGLTFLHRARPRTRVIESGGEKVEYCMSKPIAGDRHGSPISCTDNEDSDE